MIQKVLIVNDNIVGAGELEEEGHQYTLFAAAVVVPKSKHMSLQRFTLSYMLHTKVERSAHVSRCMSNSGSIIHLQYVWTGRDIIKLAFHELSCVRMCASQACVCTCLNTFCNNYMKIASSWMCRKVNWNPIWPTSLVGPEAHKYSIAQCMRA